MLKLICKVRLNQAVRAKCERHPSYDPAAEGKNHILDRCATCRELRDIYESSIALHKAVRDFERRAAPWETSRRRAPKPPSS
jgi:phage FluMu protein Com